MKPKFTKEEKKLIGRRIRDARIAEKLTLEQLARRLVPIRSVDSELSARSLAFCRASSEKLIRVFASSYRASPVFSERTQVCCFNKGIQLVIIYGRPPA